MRFVLYLIFASISFSTWATHIKAGDILAQRDANNSNRYTFTLTIYFDANRITTTNQANLVPVNQASLDFGDGSMPQSSNVSSLTSLGNNVVVGVYVFTNTFLTQGNYVISHTDFNRIGGILNMDNSINTSLNIDLGLRVDPFLGRNTTPQLLVPPIDIANKGNIYTHNPGAFDADGDSLSFELIPPKKLRGIDVDNYLSPADPRFGGEATDGTPATLTINPRNGQLTWNTPGQVGFYNIAIRVNEFRNGVLIGYVVRDMQIEVRESANRPPLVQMPNDTCLVSGTLHQRIVRISDPDNHSLIVERFGQPFNVVPGASVVGPSLPAPSPSNFTINWNPSCNLVRREPYQILVKAQDNVSQNIRLADIKNWNVKLVAPAPIWKNIERVNNTIRLSWNRYQSVCNRTSGNIRVFRSICDSNFVYDPCLSPNSIGNRNFQLIATLPITDSVFTDPLAGIGFSQGIIYNYALFVDFPSPGFGNSLPSNVISFKSEFSEPIITNIEVLSNTSLRVNIKVPKTLPNATAPFTYVIQRSLTNNNFQTIGQFNNLTSLVDTFWLDNNLNTATTRYFYRVILTASGINDLSSPSASSTLLLGTSGNRSAILNFSFSTNSDLERTDVFNATTQLLIDSVRPNQFNYTVNNLTNCDSVFFFVLPVAKFCAAGFEPFYFNKSNTVGILPKDTSKITPIPSAANNYCQNLNCENPQATFRDTITWNPAGNNDCSAAISYNLFFSPSPNGSFEKIATTTETRFVHEKERTFTGCYYVTVIRDGIESSPGQQFCLDNVCGCYELPNIITPNNDGKNDLLRPLTDPVFVSAVDFKLFNRWGKMVFRKTDDIFLNWQADEVDAGYYFYEADVSFFGISQNKKTLKGWLHVVK